MADVYVQKGVTDLSTLNGTLSDGDNLIFAEGTVAITAGLDLYVSCGVTTLNNITVATACGKTIGNGSNPLSVNVTGVVTHKGGGTLYIAPQGNGQGAEGSETNAINSVKQEGNGKVVLQGIGTFTTVSASKGEIEATGSSYLKNLYITGRGTNCKISPNDNDSIDIISFSGNRLHLQRDCTSLKVYHGRTVIDRDDTVVALLPDIGTIDHSGMSHIIFKGVGSVGDYNRTGPNAMANFEYMASSFNITNFDNDSTAPIFAGTSYTNDVATVTITGTRTDRYGYPTFGTVGGTAQIGGGGVSL